MPNWHILHSVDSINTLGSSYTKLFICIDLLILTTYKYLKKLTNYQEHFTYMYRESIHTSNMTSSSNQYSKLTKPENGMKPGLLSAALRFGMIELHIPLHMTSSFNMVKMHRSILQSGKATWLLVKKLDLLSCIWGKKGISPIFPLYLYGILTNVP